MRKNYLVYLFFLWVQFICAQYKMPVAFVTSLQPAQSGKEVKFVVDNDENTIYHSSYNLSTAMPDQLNFKFSARVKNVNRLIYKPRLSGNNGIWKTVKVSYSTRTNPSVFVDATGVITWAVNNTSKIIDLPVPIIKPAVIRIDILTSQGNYSSCAEMEFYSSEQLEPVISECTLFTSEFSAYTDIPVLPQTAGSSASSFQNGENINRSFDGDVSTIYHSNWNGTAATFPISLIYRFDGQTAINYVKYIPRQDGNDNGYFGNVKISYNTTSNPSYIPVSTNNFGQDNDTKTVVFPQEITPLNIKIEVLDGKNNFASCAEMEFFQSSPNTFDASGYSNIFNDDLFSELKPGVTQQNINAVTSPFMKGLAQCLFDNTYNKNYRVKTFTAYKKVETINQQYKLGNYNKYENSTGIAFQPNTTVIIFAKDIHIDKKVYLKIRDFAIEGSSPENSYELKNGLNIINITNGGLGYISYYTDDINAAPISLNITTGILNGLFNKETSSSEWMDMLSNGVYPKVDMDGYYTKLVIDKDAVANFHFNSGRPLIDKYDAIAKSEREMMGFFKFSKNPKNRQFVYTESMGGWYAGDLGVHLDLTWGISGSASAEDLGIWGVAHELGHINQLQPGLCWVGTTEITNNLYSLWAFYNLYTPAGTNRFTRMEEEIADETAFPKVAGNRFGEFIIQTQINGKSYADQFSTTFSTPTDEHFRTLVPFWQLELYYQLAGASKGAPQLAFDLDMSDEEIPVVSPPVSGVDYAHWFANVAEKVRNTDESSLTNGQLVMNFVKNTCDAVQEDLTDFFTRTGFLKPINATIVDYDNAQLVITQPMIDEVRNYILSKGYSKPVSPVINYLSANSVNSFKNLLPVSGVTGVGAQVTTNAQGRFLLINNSQWSNAVAFETYNVNNQLISVSIVGTGDTTLASTYVDFPISAFKVYAVGYNGQKILVYPANILSTTEISADNSFSIVPNPIKNGEEFKIIIENPKGKYLAQLFDMTGNCVTSSRGSLVEITRQLNTQIQNLKSGVYIFSLTNENQKYQSKIIKE